MKKYLLVAVVTLSALFSASSAFAQMDACPNLELIKKYMQFQDSLARFFDHVEKTTNPTDFEDFAEAVVTDSIDAFNVFGTRNTDLKDSVISIVDSVKIYTSLLKSAIDPNLQMTDTEFTSALSSQIACVNKDTTIYTVDYQLEQAFGTGSSSMRVAYLGPCEDGLRSALTSARASYNYSNLACSAGAGCPGYWKFACVGACLIANSIIYNNNKADAFCDYLACNSLGCPF